jgi:hypothetical protein
MSPRLGEQEREGMPQIWNVNLARNQARAYALISSTILCAM